MLVPPLSLRYSLTMADPDRNHTKMFYERQRIMLTVLYRKVGVRTEASRPALWRRGDRRGMV